MKLRRLTIKNARSFADGEALTVAGDLVILIGPNGGGKTNLLDTLVYLLRGQLLTSGTLRTDNNTGRKQWREVDRSNMRPEKNSSRETDSQILAIELEVTSQDRKNMDSIVSDREIVITRASRFYETLPYDPVNTWNHEPVRAGARFVYEVVDGRMTPSKPGELAKSAFLSYLRMYEKDAQLREEFGLRELTLPVSYFTVGRAVGTPQSRVSLANFDAYSQRHGYEATNSRSNNSPIPLAIGRLAQQYRLLLEEDKGNALPRFLAQDNVSRLTKVLEGLGYRWEWRSIDPYKNEYDIELSKRGSRFLIGNASSGEKEILTYLLGIFALNVRDAILLVDEPELHLHPTWQKELMRLFVDLASETGNQFVLATHSPAFVEPETIQHVSRVHFDGISSRITNFDAKGLPSAKHQLQIINSQNNEKIFFADLVVLVEGISDRIFWKWIFKLTDKSKSAGRLLEVVDVGGKGMFEPYKSVLDSASIPYAVVSDLDHLAEIGTGEVRALFRIDESGIREDVIDNHKSFDGIALNAAIEAAIQNQSFDELQDIWTYIRSRKRHPKPDLSSEDSALIATCISDLRSKRHFVLAAGSLEDYLPPGHRRKDLSDLIRLVSSIEAVADLPAPGRDEVQRIADGVLSLLPKAENSSAS